MKIQIKTKGFINLISRNKVELNSKGNPKIYRSKKLMLIAKKVAEYRSRAKSEFNKALVKAGILESAVNTAKSMFKASKESLLNSVDYFNAMLPVWRANKDLREFKSGLNRSFAKLLF